MKDHAFLLFKPEACSAAFLDFAVTFLRDAGVSVDECVTRPTAELRREGVVERHYGNTHRYATAPSDALDALVHHNDTVKSRFFAAFGELWDDVVAQGRLLPAHEAMVVLGNLTPQELSGLWWGNSAMHAPDSLGYISSVPVRLFRGLRVVRLSRDNVYVINGHYPALHARMTCDSSESSCTWITLSWPESSYTWEQVSTNVIGVPDPQQAAVTSLRYAYIRRYAEWGLRTTPTVELNGFELSPGPLAAMAARVLWTRREIEDDAFGRRLLQEGLPALFVRRLLHNPLLLEADTITSVNDMLLHQHESRALHTLSELYVHLREVEDGGDDVKRATLVYDGAPDGAPVHPTEGCEQAELAQRRNHAILFVKPHAYHKRVFHLIRETLTRRVAGLTVDQVRDVDAAWIERHGVIDQHYGLLSYFALTVTPAALELSEATQDTFREKFGLTWLEANAQGRVWNARTALYLLGDCSPVELFQYWSVASVMRLCSGAYVGRLHLPDATSSSSTLVGFGGAEDSVRGRTDTVFVVNGFYPYVREMFVSSGSRVHCLAVSWPETSLSWADFRTSVVGSTDPRKAPAESLRGMVLRQWHDLGLGHEPNTTENALHASAGPLEAMVERHLWFGTGIEDDALIRRLRTRGLSAAMALQWAGNPLVHSMGGRCGNDGDDTDTRSPPDRVFDLVENVQTSEFVEVVRQAEQHALARCRDEEYTNHALVLLHPSAVTERSVALVADVLTRANVQIETHGSRFRYGAARRVLQMPAMRELRHLASLRGAALRAALPAEAEDSFLAHFHKTLQASEERLCGAWVFCMEGEEGGDKMNATELMHRWSAAQPVRLARHCHVAYLANCDRYVINGFLPYLYETMALPESRWYYYAVRWQERDWTWADFSTILIGTADVQAAAAGSLQRTLSERWKELGLTERPCVRAQCSITASTGPLEAIAERALWLMPDEDLDRATPLALSELYARRLDREPMMQWLLMHGVPRPLVVHYAWGYKASQCARAVSVEAGVRQRISCGRQSSDCVRQLSAVAAEMRRECGTQHAFLWLHPFAACDAVIDALPAVLATHKVRVCGSGQVSMAHAVAHNLLDSTYNALYRNAWTRCATQMPLSHAERNAFAATFQLSWQTAVQLSLVLNAREAVQRLGEARALHAWDVATRKTRLSSALYVAYFEQEGIYVVNGFYPYVRARLYTGERVVWFDLAFYTDDTTGTTWDSFLTNAIGDTTRPKEAVAGSLVHHLTQKWSEYGLAGPPDEMASGLHISPSPMAAMAERCAWCHGDARAEGEGGSMMPEEDTLGRLLWRAGLTSGFLRNLVQNPLVYQSSSSHALHDEVHEAFDMLPVQSTSALISTLRQWQHDPGLAFLAADTVFTPSVTPPTITANMADGEAVAEETAADTNESMLQRALEHAVPVTEHYRPAVLDATLPITVPLEAEEMACTGDAQEGQQPCRSATAQQFGSGDMNDGKGRSRLEVNYNVKNTSSNNNNGGGGEEEEDAVHDEGDDARAVSAAEAATGTSDATTASRSSALLTIDPGCLLVSRPTPTFSIDVYRDVVLPLLRDYLAAHGVSIVYEGLLPAAEADARLLFTRHHAQLMRYATQLTAVYDVLRSPAQQARFAQIFGQPLSAVQLHTAHDLAAEFNLTAANVDELWKTCSPIACFAHDLYIGKLATDDVYLVNGFAPHASEQFHTPAVGKPYVIVSWQDRAMSYERFCDAVIGQPHIAEAEAGSLQAALQRGAVATHLGLPLPAQPFLGFVQSSTSALSAMQQRELWLQLSLHCDLLGRKVFADYYVSPCVLRWALSNPVCHRAHDASDAVYLFDLLRGKTTRPTLQHLSLLEDAHRQESPRNTALIVIQPHALCSRLARRIEHSLTEHDIRIDEEGDLSGTAVRERGVVRYLYPVDMGYAVRDPATIVLTPSEQDRFYDVFGLTWQELVLTGTVLNAYQALQAFVDSDATPQRLYRDSRAARNRVWLRPALEVSELTELGVFVINGYVPALKESFESPRALLHWYIVSWPEAQCGWRDFVQDVVGNADPQCAAPHSIRGRLFRRWRDYGLHTIPDCIQNGVHVSDSPLQALGERLRLLQRPLIEDPLGDLLLRDDVHLGLLRLWLDNPDVVTHGITAGVLEHVANCDTSRLVHTLTSVSQALRATQDATLNSAAPDTSSLAAPDDDKERQGVSAEVRANGTSGVETGTMLRPAKPALRSDTTSPVAMSEPTAPTTTAAAQDNFDASWGSRMQLPDDDLLLFRNAATLVLKPHIARNTAAIQLLMDVLQKHQIHVVGTGEREATASLVDELCFTQAFYALHKNVALALQQDARLNSEDGAAHFARVFGEPWADVLADTSRLMSAKTAMQRLHLSPDELYSSVVAATGDGVAAESWSIGHDLVISRLTRNETRVYVVNGSYPAQQASLLYLNAGSGAKDSAIAAHTLTMLLVVWDERQLSWRAFAEGVIGDEVPSRALPGSFRAELVRHWSALALTTPPEACLNGVLVSASPLQAFAQRTTWFGVSAYVPDTLIRSASYAALDSTVLLNWAENPLVAFTVTSQVTDAGKDAEAVSAGFYSSLPSAGVCRIFDLCHHMDTSGLLRLVRGAEMQVRLLGPRRDLQLKAEDVVTQDLRSLTEPQSTAARRHAPRHCTATTLVNIAAPEHHLTRKARSEATARTESSTTVAASETRTAAPPRTLPCCEDTLQSKLAQAHPRLHRSIVRDALLNARGTDAVRELWNYYVTRSDRRINEKDETIDFALFRSDYDALENYGVPFLHPELRRLFDKVALFGRMRYDEFARTLALYQTL